MSTGLFGPYDLTLDIIDKIIQKMSVGTYVLEREYSSDGFTVNYVGRSDNDLNSRLKNWFGVRGYKRFKYGYLPSPSAAFDHECAIYHGFSGLDNENHPQRPIGLTRGCSRCRMLR